MIGESLKCLRLRYYYDRRIQFGRIKVKRLRDPDRDQTASDQLNRGQQQLSEYSIFINHSIQAIVHLYKNHIEVSPYPVGK